MRGFVASFAILLIFTLAGCGEEKLVERKPPVVPLEIRPASISFGDVVLGEQRSEKVRVRAGSLPVSLSIDVSDLPSSFEITPVEVVDLAAGEEVSYQVVFHPTERGPAEGTIGFSSGAGRVAELRVTGRGVVPATEWLTVEGDMDFGDVRVGGEATLPLTFENHSDDPLLVQVVEGRQDVFQLEHDRFELAPGEKRDISTIFRPQVRGSAFATFWIDGCGDCDLLTVDLVGRGVIEALQASPSRVSFPRLPVDSGLTRRETVTVTNVGDLAVELAGVVVEGDSFSASVGEVPVRLEVGEGIEIEATFMPVAPGTSRGVISLEDPRGSALLQVPLLGTGGGPRLEAAPVPIDFGMVHVNSTAVIPVTIENVGDPASVTLVAAEIVGRDATLFDVVYPRGAGIDPLVEAQVSFSPTREGDFHAELLLFTDAPDQPTLLVPLSGSSVDVGIPPPFEPVDICQFQFGSLWPENWVGSGQPNSRRVRFTNTGTETCLMWNFHVSNPNAFYIVDAPAGVVALAPGEAKILVEVGMTPSVPPKTTALGLLLFETQAGPYNFLWISMYRD